MVIFHSYVKLPEGIILSSYPLSLTSARHFFGSETKAAEVFDFALLASFATTWIGSSWFQDRNSDASQPKSEHMRTFHIPCVQRKTSGGRWNWEFADFMYTRGISTRTSHLLKIDRFVFWLGQWEIHGGWASSRKQFCPVRPPLHGYPFVVCSLGSDLGWGHGHTTPTSTNQHQPSWAEHLTRATAVQRACRFCASDRLRIWPPRPSDKTYLWTARQKKTVQECVQKYVASCRRICNEL